MRIRILEPAPVDHRWFHANIRTPSLGPPILATALRNAGHDATVHSEFVSEIPWPTLRDADVVGICANTGLTHQRAYQFAELARRYSPNAHLVAGGHHATTNAQEALQHVDYVIRGFAEEALPALVKALDSGITTPAIAGLCYRNSPSGEFVEHPQSNTTNLDVIPDLHTIQDYRDQIRQCRWSVHRFTTFLPLSYYSRGCGFHCDFCSVPLADKPAMSYRSPETVIEDIRQQLEFYSFPYARPKVWLIDDNFGQHISHTYHFLEALADASLPCGFVVEARIEIGRHEKLLRLMQKAGVSSVYVGIESVAPESLKSMMKHTTVHRIKDAVQSIQQHGLSVVALLMFGCDGDRPGVARRTAAFLKSLGVTSVLPQVTVPYPGTGFHRRVLEEGRLFSKDYSLCNRQPVHFPTTIRPSQVVEEICEFTCRHYSYSRVLRDLLTRFEFQNLIARRGIFADGFLARTLATVPRLRQIEETYYDSEDRLRMEKLRRHHQAGVLAERVAEAGFSDVGTLAKGAALV